MGRKRIEAWSTPHRDVGLAIARTKAAWTLARDARDMSPGGISVRLAARAALLALLDAERALKVLQQAVGNPVIEPRRRRRAA